MNGFFSPVQRVLPKNRWRDSRRHDRPTLRHGLGLVRFFITSQRVLGKVKAPPTITANTVPIKLATFRTNARIVNGVRQTTVCEFLSALVAPVDEEHQNNKGNASQRGHNTYNGVLSLAGASSTTVTRGRIVVDQVCGRSDRQHVKARINTAGKLRGNPLGLSIKC